MADNKLHTAVRYGNEEETLQALKEGFNPNEIGMLRWSPVHEASHNGERDILKLLLLFKGDVNQKDGLHGNTPLHYAAQEDNSACVTVLLNAGAKLDVKNDQGRTPLDIATSSCMERMEPFINNSQNRTGEDWQPGGSKDGKTQDKDQTQWQGLDDVPSNAAIGFLHLSFEFHKNTLKVRVWQITDLLLPPPQTSMIESIFVRGYLIPDPAKKTIRKTEDILVDPNPKKDNSRRQSSPRRASIQHIFTPSSFRFDSPLIYTGVTDEIVSERSIQLEVCMTQKHTHKPFLMAMVHMPLRTAVRRPIREKYPLIPCMNYTIPNSMRVYSAKDIFVEGTSEVVVNISRSNSLQSNPDSTHSNSSLDTLNTLQDIHIDKGSVPEQTGNRKLITVNISESSEDDLHENDKDNYGDDDENIDDGIGSSLDVKICSGKGSASSSVNVDVLDSSLNETESKDNIDETLKDIVIHRTHSFGKETSVVDMEKVSQSLVSEQENKKRKRIIPSEFLVKSFDNEDEDEDNVRGDDACVQSTVIEVEAPVKETVIDISKLSKDTVLDIDLMTDSGYDNESVQSESSPISESKELTSNKRKKRIIPNEIKTDRHSIGDGENEDDNKTLTSESNKTIHLNEPEDDEISKELTPTRLLSSSSQISSESSKDKSSTPTAGSRPETPVWDFYDFACNDESAGAQTSAQTEENTTENSNNTNSLSTKEPASPTSTSTLQESLARLSRPQPVLNTCHVPGPVLPSILIMEDFEMDEES